MTLLFSLNKILNKQSICRWFDALWRSCDVTLMNKVATFNIIWFSRKNQMLQWVFIIIWGGHSFSLEWPSPLPCLQQSTRSDALVNFRSVLNYMSAIVLYLFLLSLAVDITMSKISIKQVGYQFSISTRLRYSFLIPWCIAVSSSGKFRGVRICSQCNLQQSCPFHSFNSLWPSDTIWRQRSGSRQHWVR